MELRTLTRRGINKLKRIRDYIKDRCIYFFLCDVGFRAFKKTLLRIVLRNRLIVAFYGECHIYIYGGFLNNIRELRKKYLFLGSKEIEYLARFHDKYINRKTSWDKLDVIIYNPSVPTRDGAPTLEEVLSWVPESCKKIEVTNAAFKGYMPQHTGRVFENSGYFTWGDKNLNQLLSCGDVDDTVLDDLSRSDYYSTEFVNDYFEKSVKHMKQYERQCTVKIADYIEQHGRNRVLYYSVTHPEMEIMCELTRRILLELGVEADRLLDNNNQKNDLFDLHSHGEVVYPSVYQGLGIKQDQDLRRIQPGNYKELTYTFREYIEEYIKMGKESVVSRTEGTENE